MKVKLFSWGILLLALGVLLASESGCARREQPAAPSEKPRTGPVEEVFAQAQAKAVAAKCLSNLKQLAFAFMMYQEDYDGCFPPADKWVDVLGPYQKDRQVLQCPADKEHEFGYAFNRALSGKRLADIPYPSKTPLLFDSTAGKKNAADEGQSWPEPSRHLDANNCAFVDGHVEPVREKPNFKP